VKSEHLIRVRSLFATFLFFVIFSHVGRACSRHGSETNAYRFVLGRPGIRCGDTINVELERIVGECALGSSGSGWRPMADAYERGDARWGIF
jgi:hypothetical protein